MAGPTERVLQLLSLLQTHQHWRGSDLATRLGVSERTVRRDVDRLRTLGYPVDALPGVEGGYRLAAGAHLPPLLLDDDEAVAVAVGLRSATAGGLPGIDDTVLRVLLKLEQVLPDRLRRRVLIGAYLFGGITVLQLNLQAAGSAIPVEYLSMSPYLVTIIVLVIMSSGKGRASLNAPAALGQNFHAAR